MAWKPMLPVMYLPLQPLELTGTVPVCSRSAFPSPRSQSYLSSCPRMIFFISHDKT